MSAGRPAEAHRAMVGRLDYPMFVVTAANGDEESGCLAGFVTQCSIRPPRYLVCVSKENHTFLVAAGATGLGLHLLGDGQHDLAARFGELTGDRTDKLAGVAWRPGATGAPLLSDCSAWVEGRVLDRVDLGDHVGHVIEPVGGGAGPVPGHLLWSQVQDLDPGHPA